MSSPSLSFLFRGKPVPVTTLVPHDLARQALVSAPFLNWVTNCERVVDDQRLEIHGVEIQSVDLFGARGVGFVKINSKCTLVDGTTHHEHALPGICFLRGHAVTILVALFCNDGTQYSLLVRQPRVPIGQVSCLELPAGMMDDETQSIAGIAVQEMQQECGIPILPKELVDLTELAGSAGLAPSPGGCDELCRFLYLEKKVTVKELQDMKGRLTGLREHGEVITLQVVPMDQVWQVSMDAKAIIALFLVEQLRKQGKLKPAGELATPLSYSPEPKLAMNNGITIPQLAFGLYLVPADKEGEETILSAVKAGYRHFDTATYYGNESTLGRALKQTGIPRQDFFIASKVWNDAVKGGRDSVRKSVMQSVADLDFGGYYDLFLVHWPVPGHFVEAYKELENLLKEGVIRSIGVSNFSISEDEELVQGNITVPPVLNQFEVSPVMFRRELIEYFQDKGILVGASKPLNRAACLDNNEIQSLAKKYGVTPAQVVLRWGLQKKLVLLPKTATPSRMTENRSILHFALSDEDMSLLDSLTTPEDLQARAELEITRKTSL